MDLPSLAKRTLDRTSNLHRQLYRFLEDAVENSRTKFDPKDFDPWYFTHTVRYELCKQIDAVPEETRDFKRVPFPMSGIEVEYLEFRVKVLKINAGENPIGGHSTVREELLEQRQPMLDQYLDAINLDDPIPLKLFIAWDVDQQLHLKSVNLVCPRTFDSPWRPGEDYFTIPVPHPATRMDAPTEFTEEPDELDIPLERKRAASDGDDGN